MALTTKGIEKKLYILEKAAAVFIKKGYTAVTMKDIVDECGISRGGLYKYYASTQEIFLDILSVEKEDDGSFFTEGMENGVNAIKIFSEFLRQQKNELLNVDNTIRLAVYEFFLSHRDHDATDILKRQYTDIMSVLSQVLHYGIARNEITKITLGEVENTANQVIILLEGLNILALSKQISSQLIDEQFGLLIKNIK